MKRWYVIQVYTGFEDIVRADLSKRIQEEHLEELFGDVVIPTNTATSIFTGASEDPKIKHEKIFPGYLLIQMEMVSESYRLVVEVPRVTRFLGGISPMALSAKEVERIFAQMSGKTTITTDKALFVEGSEIHIVNGPFSGFVGIVERVDDEHEKLIVMVSIFGRLTPVELGFDQVKC
jgi:transcriptional antiterminator NusG